MGILLAFLVNGYIVGFFSEWVYCISSLVHNISRIDQTHLGHSRYGHIPIKSLSLLQKNYIVIGLSTMSENDCNCEICVLSKHKRDSFPTSSSRAKEPLALVHTDICGPMQTLSIGGSFYFLTFIDDYNRKIWVYFLKIKSDIFSRFKEFKIEVEKKSGKLLKVLRSERGGEYNLNEFKTFCRQ